MELVYPELNLQKKWDYLTVKLTINYHLLIINKLLCLRLRKPLLLDIRTIVSIDLTAAILWTSLGASAAGISAALGTVSELEVFVVVGEHAVLVLCTS